ncbi:Hypothetical_protein [Hexamita inflata]|uniref:Hypothetical_protein n=1 Tax=Hexamita inflata TaxID=28002 RepID=A0AA86QRW2_9EUKA|nr:Hypothetical protein HINF_LOCUS47981 [Hexamita inflata]
MQKFGGTWNAQDVIKINNWFINNKSFSQFINLKIIEEMNIQYTSEQLVDLLAYMNKKYKYNVNEISYSTDFKVGSNAFEYRQSFIEKTEKNQQIQTEKTGDFSEDEIKTVISWAQHTNSYQVSQRNVDEEIKINKSVNDIVSYLNYNGILCKLCDDEHGVPVQFEVKK